MAQAQEPEVGSHELHGVCLTLAYEGTAFAGWASQPGQRTVQSVLEKAVRDVAGHEVKVLVASRTDAGVHAAAQIAAFASERPISAEGWVGALNGKLPEDVVVRNAILVDPTYNPRNDSRGKHYRYLIQVGKVRDPLMRTRAWYLHPGMVPPSRANTDEIAQWLDLDAMRAAAAPLVGTHDFIAFQGNQDERENTTRTLSRIDVTPCHLGRQDLLAIDVHGTAFLKNMVRILAGTLVEVARGRMEVNRVAALVSDGAHRQLAGPTAPAHGLCLLEVLLGRLYDNRAREDR